MGVFINTSGEYYAGETRTLTPEMLTSQSAINLQGGSVIELIVQGDDFVTIMIDRERYFINELESGITVGRRFNNESNNTGEHNEPVEGSILSSEDMLQQRNPEQNT